VTESVPRLTPVPPTRGAELSILTSPFRIGRSAASELRLHLPGVNDVHATIIERQDGFWLVPAPQPAAQLVVNGTAVAGPVRLRRGDVIQIVPGAVYRFHDGVVIPKEQPAPPPPPTYAAVPPVSGRGRRRLLPRLAFRKPSRATVVIVVVTLVALSAVTVLVLRPFRSPAPPETLSDSDALHFDTLMERAYAEVERGTTLLDAGSAQLALQHYARAVNVLETSRLRDNPWIRPRITALEAAIGNIYRSKRLEIPDRYRERTADFNLAALLRAGLNVDQFARGLGLLESRFAERFGKSFVVTGRDHAEHLSLYGNGGAVDVRVRDLSRAEIGFLIENARAMGIRVKDFSSDSVLADQIRRAHAAGVPDRAGTGLHLHLDRFASRRDRYTVD